MIVHISEKNYNPDLDLQNRQIQTPSSAFGILRQTLVSNIGQDRIKGFLIRFGMEMGVNDAKLAMKANLPIQTLFKQGPIYHCLSGQISGSEYEGYFEMDDDHNILSVYGTGTWIDSYEAMEHIKSIGISKSPVCHTLIGYASGFMTTISGQQVLAKEVSCVGAGDSECRWVMKTQNEWDAEIWDELDFYNQIPIVKELQYTYEQLLEQKESVTRLMNFQEILTEEIANGSDLQKIIDIVYELIQIPIIIDDIDFHNITYAGLIEAEFNLLQKDMFDYLKTSTFIILDRKNKDRLPFRKRIYDTNMQRRLVVPILIEKKVFGFCSFLYKNSDTDKIEEDYLLLARIANAASLILLNEKTQFEAFERMKGIFLEQLINGHLTSKKEIIAKGRYTGLDLSKPYHLAILEWTSKQKLNEDEYIYQQKILDSIYQYFKKIGMKVLISNHRGNFILFLTNDEMLNTKIEAVLQRLNKYLYKNYPKFKFKFGVSNEGSDIEKLMNYYEEASIALRLNSTKRIVLFKTLGIVGILINSNNIDGIKMIAKQELGPLLNIKDSKMEELLRTLYVFLLNGGKLEPTLNDLSISMSGLLYRIKKIENMLDKNLREPTDTYQLLLIIESLVALGELKI